MTTRPRIIGTETEFGILHAENPKANPIHLSAQAVWAYPGRPSNTAECEPVTWDYAGEDPLNDLRGHRIERAAADPSQLTDNPLIPAPSGPATGENGRPATGKKPVWQSRQQRPSEAQNALLRPPAYVLSNGARFYVDHAHPEYSGPECAGAFQATLYDRAGDELARRVMESNPSLVLYKNNQDGKGASYGTHENYLVERHVDFKDLVRVLTPFFVTRPLICGSGRVGIGQRGQRPGFQISQRADFVENTVGLETTFNRPIINTRDEPHALASRWRRLHVIGGDANLFDTSTFLRLGSTSLVLHLLETGAYQRLLGLELVDDPVLTTWEVSHDLTLTKRLRTVDGRELTAIEIQREYWDAVAQTDFAADDAVSQILSLWDTVLKELKADYRALSDRVEWIAKLTLLDAMRQRLRTGWDHDKLKAMDLLWADLRPEFSLVEKLKRAGKVEQLFSNAEISYALENPPTQTRAALRAMATHLPELASASWTSLLLDGGGEDLTRLLMLDPYAHPQTGGQVPRSLSEFMDVAGTVLGE